MFRKLRPVLVILLVFAITAAARDFSMPRAFHAKTYPARDVHENEQFSIAADPYDLPDKSAPVFTVDYLKEGLLPIQVVFSNDGDTPVTIARASVTFITRTNVKLTPANSEDIYRRISKQLKRGDEPNVGGLPIPIGRKKTNVSSSARQEVETISQRPKAIEPKTTQSAVYIFDVQGLDHPLAGARLVVSGVTRNNEELFYFEIPMEKYLTYTPAPPPQQ
jgi:hypothetical protein